MSGATLTQSIRSKAFASLLRQELAYFDRPENTSGAISARLCSDALSVQQLISARLGLICETFAILFVFLTFGFLISWQLTLIVLVSLFIIATTAYLNVRLEIRANNREVVLLRRASSAKFRGEINFDRVTFSYPSRPRLRILDNIQLSIMPGQRVALVGSSGSGKSTIIYLLERFYDVSNGQLLIDGTNIQELNINAFRSHLGLVSQEPILFDLTIAENIAYGLEQISSDEVINAAKKANIHSFIGQLPQ
ncbi:unnamed protein product, partial [Rotaria sp. Silwood1]